MIKHLPNILTVIRLLLVPFFPIAYFSQSPNSHKIALAIFIIASVTDVLDGFIARRFNLVTKIGTVLDPLADKLMLLTAVITLYIGGDLPLAIPIIIVCKELFMIIGGLYLYFKKESKVIPANKIGKAATILYALAVFITILFPSSLASLILISAAIAIKLVAIGVYAYIYFTQVKNQKTS